MPESPVDMNSGQAMSTLLLAAMQGQNSTLKPAAGWLRLYKAKGLNAATYINKLLGTNQSVQGSGSVITPFASFGYAVTQMGKVKTLAGYEQPRVLVVQGGTHDVSAVTLPMGRWIIVLERGAKLTGALKQELVVAEAFGSVLPPGVAIINADSAPGEAAFDNVTWVQGAGAAVTSTFLYARGCTIDDTVVAPATVTTINVELERCSVGEIINVEVIGVFRDCVFARLVSVDNFIATGCEFFFDITVVAASEFHDCRFNAAPQNFTGPALSARLDGNSNFSFKVGPWVLLGGATKVIITDIVP